MGYWIGVVVSLSLLSLAVFAEVYQYQTGMGPANLNWPHMWDLYIATFIFWIGMSHSGTLLSAILHITHADWRKPIYRFAEAMTTFTLMTAGLFPIIHIGRLWNMYWVLPYYSDRGIWPNFRSPLVWDAFAIGTYLTSSALFLYIGSVPDLAICRDSTKGWRQKLYTVLSLGWRGDDRQWRNFRKAYLIMAGQGARSTPEFLGPQLYGHWPGRVGLSPNAEALARDQFAFYARELAVEDPFDFRPHQPLVDSSRDFIRSFADEARFYSALVDEASRQAVAISFAEMHPDAAGVVRNDVLVPAAFTAEGWDFVHRRLDDPDALFGFEDWVVGGDPPPPEERRALAAELRARYEAEYVRRWAEFISASSFRRSGAVATTARQLQMLGGRESPVLQVLAVVSENTDVDSTVAAVFEPVHLVVPPGEAALVGEGNQAYVDALASIAMALAPLAEPAGSGGAAGGAVTQSATQAEDAVRQVALAFPVDGDAGAIADAVEQLLRQPIVSARSLARGLPSQQANAAGSSFCADFRALSASYPFATGGPDASLEDFVAMFQPDESTLWAYYDRTLQNFLEPRGSRFEAIPNSSPTATPELVRFFNDAAMITSTFWESGNESGPELVFGLQLRTSDRLTEVEVQVDNQVHTFTQTAPGMASVIWVGEGAREARITGVLDGRRVPLVAPQDGQWALFELFRTASWVPRGARTFDVVWQLPGSMPPLEGTVSMNTDVPVLSRDFLAGLRCVSTIVR